MSGAQLSEVLRESIFPGNTAAFEGLKEYMRQGGLTALTGAGVSAPIFPTWTALLSRWLDEAVQQGFVSDPAEITEYEELLQKDPLELAEFLEQIFTKPIFRARLAEIFRNKSAQATDCHHLISDLPVRGIVTLNYDNGHEIAYATKGRNPNQGKAQDTATMVRWMQSEVFNDADNPILHFHGDVSDPNQMVLTSSDYDQFYSRELPDRFLGHLWTTHRLLVIGFGFSDPFLTRVAEHTLRALPTDTRHYALIGKNKGEAVSPIQRRMLAKKYRAIHGYMRVLNFACLLRAKPKGWLAAASEMVANTDRKEFYLRIFLMLAFDQFYDEVNTNAEREDLKRLIAIIRIKRDLRKDHPGEKDIQQIIARLEKLDVFEQKSEPDDAAKS